MAKATGHQDIHARSPDRLRAVEPRGPVIRLSLGENPYGMAAEVRQVVADELERGSWYPDGDAVALRAGLCEMCDVGGDMVMTGNGIDELLLLCALGLMGRGGAGVVSARTFLGHEAAVRTAGGRPIPVGMSGYRIDVGRMDAAIRRGVDLVFVCNPHNPAGTSLGACDVDRLVRAAKRCGAVIVFDEAYAEYAEPGTFCSALPWAREGQVAIVLRSFSKIHGLAGFRCGYAIGPARLIAKLTRARKVLPFNVNRLAQTAALAALGCPHHVEQSRKRNREARDRLCRGLGTLGLAYIPSETNFVLVRTPVAGSAVCGALLREYGIAIRDGGSFGYPNHVRVSVGTLEHMEQFLEGLRHVVGSLAS